MATAFRLRDGTFELLRDGKYRMSPTAMTLLWFLLFHGWYDPNSRWCGHVDIKVTAQSCLSIATGRDVRSVRRGLVELEQAGFIKRTKRFDKTGNQLSDDIKLTSPDDFCWTCRVRGHGEEECTEGG